MSEQKDCEETTSEHPKSWAAWKRRAEAAEQELDALKAEIERIVSEFNACSEDESYQWAMNEMSAEVNERFAAAMAALEVLRSTPDA